MGDALQAVIRVHALGFAAMTAKSLRTSMPGVALPAVSTVGPGKQVAEEPSRAPAAPLRRIGTIGTDGA